MLRGALLMLHPGAVVPDPGRVSGSGRVEKGPAGRGTMGVGAEAQG